jgi:pyrroloquinoline quinone biosynthesis protein B
LKTLIILFLIFFSEALYSQDFILLGVTQDAGYPQIACQKSCCKDVWNDLSIRKYPVSMAVTDTQNGKWYLIDATPDMKYQISLFNQITNYEYPYMPEAIIITHAHIGHYTGLMDLGKEAMNAKNLKIYGSKKFTSFISKNGPWEQLVKSGNIDLRIFTEKEFSIAENISISPLKVPHRDEYSDTYSFVIKGKNGKALYIPDIDKWNLWKHKITDLIEDVDVAFIDATFYSGEELNARRNISEIPHPFVIESMNLFTNQSKTFKNKIHFIHLNHTNPLLRNSKQKMEVEAQGYNIGVQGKVYSF